MSAPVPVCVLNDTRVDLHHGCARVMASIEALLRDHGCEVLATCPAHRDWTADPRFMGALERARLIVVNGEGTLHHDRPAARRLLEAGAWAKAHGVPAALINASWEANGPALARMLGDFALVAVRDSASAAELAAHGRAARVVPDLSLHAVSSAAARGARAGMLFTDSVDRSAALALEACRARCDGETLSILYAAPGFTGYLGFLRRGIGRDDLRDPDRAVRMLRLRHRLHRRATPNTEAFLGQLRSAALVVSGRLHACTLALATGTPFVAHRSNTGKIAAFLADCGVEAWRGQVPLEPIALAEAMARGWSRAEQAAREEFLAGARTSARALFHDLRAMAA